MDVVVFRVLTLCFFIMAVRSHGRLVEPPSRSSMWRFGFKTPPNYDDNALNCGGKQRQWYENDGKCGICGDPYDDERLNEAGGKYATGTIVRTYDRGQSININVELTAAHGGWFEFRICSNNDPTKVATLDCLNENLLQEIGGTSRHETVPFGGEDGGGVISMRYQLPENLSCSQCVLQWKYYSAKDWGCDATTNRCALGLGPQEQFFGCADIAITDGGNTPIITKITTTHRPKTTSVPVRTTTAPKPNTTTQQPKTTSVPVRMTTAPKSKTTRPIDKTRKESCVAKGIFRGSIMDNRCRFLCQMGTCPQLLCSLVCKQLLPN